MNRAHTLSLIRDRFLNVTEVGNDLFRAERRNNGSIIGVFYFEFGQPLGRSGFDLTDYLQRVVASDFYKNEGSLQWNYYLYFVLERALFNRVWNNGTAANIEADRVFARKFVKSEELLAQELSEPLAERVGTTRPPKDIAAAWTEALVAGGLGKICDSKAPYSRIVEDFLSGETEQQSRIATVPLTRAELGRPIRKLHIKRFRQHPLLRYYEFAQVNLFRGANGVGKTSLLEAIELSLCGGILRQDGGRPSGAHLDISFDGADHAERCPKPGTSLYRARDLAWYGQYNRIGNRLCHNFGRFNFFDSDAAFRLSSAKTSEEIKKAIGTLFLGEQANTLEERMVACEDRFATEERQIWKKLSSLRKQTLKWKSEMEALEQLVDTREVLLDDVRAKASRIRWKNPPVKINVKGLVRFKSSVDDIVSALAQSLRQIDWLPTLSIRNLKAESRRLKTALTEIKALQISAAALAAKVGRTNERTSQIQAELILFERLQAYHEADALSLLGIEKELEQSRAKLSQQRTSLVLLGEIDHEFFRPIKTSFLEYRQNKKDEVAHLRKEIRWKRNALDTNRLILEQRTDLVDQIRGLGHRFCELNPESNDCPLCGAHYEIEKLIDRIGPFTSESGVESGLSKLDAEIAREEKTLFELETILGNLDKLGEAASFVLAKTDLQSSSLESIMKKLTSGTVIGNELEEMTLKQSRLNRLGFSEAEISSILSQVTSTLGVAPEILPKPSTVLKEVTTRRKSLSALNKKLVDYQKKEKDFKRQLREKQEQALGSYSSVDQVVELERRFSLVEDLLAVSGRIEQSVPLPISTDFAQLNRRLATFSDSLSRTQQALKQLEEKDVLEKRLEASLKESEKEASTLEPRHERARRALDLIGGLLKSENKEKYFNDTVKDHRERLSTLFCRIHAPNEFAGVELNGELSMKRRDGTSSRVFEISTGQRAALALSIFLAMNSSVSSRAPWLIFDDPVAHVDDLNILSFFDTLRDVLLLGNQQIFFATANSRIADLFMRKFDFLGTEGLKQFPLDRPN